MGDGGNLRREHVEYYHRCLILVICFPRVSTCVSLACLYLGRQIRKTDRIATEKRTDHRSLQV